MLIRKFKFLFSGLNIEIIIVRTEHYLGPLNEASERITLEETVFREK